MIAIHHVQISIPLGKLQEGIDFYTQVMGFTVLERPESLHHIEGCWLAVGELQVHLKTEADHLKGRGEHVAYKVDDINEWETKLSSFGFEIMKNDPIPGIERFEFRDPFDNRIEMLSVAKEL